MAANYSRTEVGPGLATTDQINNELEKIYTALQDCVSRSGNSPNAMGATLDMGDNDIIHVGTISVDNLVVDGTDLASKLQEAADSAAAAAASASQAETAETGAEAALYSFQGVYWGAYASEPALDPNGEPADNGDIYYNTTESAFYVFSGGSWLTFPLVINTEDLVDGAVTRDKVNSDIVTQVPDVATLRTLEGEQVVYVADAGSGTAGIYNVVTSADPEDAPYTYILDDGHRAVLSDVPQNILDLISAATETGLVHAREVLSGGGSLEASENTVLSDSGTYVLPDTTGLAVGTCISVITTDGAEPQVDTFGAETIVSISGSAANITLSPLSFYEFYWDGTSWEVVEASGTATEPLEILLDENALAISNGDSVAPFEGDTGNLSVGTGELELVGTGSSVQLPMLSIGNQGLVVYGSIRSDSPTEYSAVRLVHSNAADMVFFFNYNIDTASRQAGTLSFRSRLSGGTNQDSKVLATGLDFTANYKFVIEWTKPSGAGLTYINFYDDNGADLSLVNSGEAPGGTAAAGAEIVSLEVDNDSASFSGTTYIQYLQASAPNFTSIGDSICAGHNNYDPDPSYYAGIDDYSSSWQCHLRTAIKTALPSLRNNFVYNRGVGGQDSSQIFGRLEDMLADNSPVVIIGGPNNDYGSAISYGNRADNLNRMIQRSKDANSSVVLLGSIVPNTAAGGYPRNANYYDKWNEEFLSDTNADLKVDIMESGIRQSGERYIDTTIAEDGVHPSAAGYESIGVYIGSELTPLLSV